jgi:omega-amidase
MRIALVSLDQIWLDKEANYLRCRELVYKAMNNGCELAILPEMTLTGYSLDIAAIAESEAESFTLASFGILAVETQLDIVFGACLFDPDTSRPRNQFCLARPDGSSRPIYAKIHPFSFTGEDKVLEAGLQIGSFKVESGELGASICYDLRFPEIYAAMAPTCNATIVIANWPARRVAHWRTLLMARAIENQSYMLGVNRIGIDGNGNIYEKSTLVVAPDGTPLRPLVPGEEIDIYEIDLEESVRYRTAFPTIQDKRYALYREFFGVHSNVN